MFKIENNCIKITKGDTAQFDVNIGYINGVQYVMQPGDTLRMTVRKRIGSAVLLEVESTTNRITLPHEKTVNLVKGNCVFDVELKNAAGEVATIVGPRDNSTYNMYVIGEVTE